MVSVGGDKGVGGRKQWEEAVGGSRKRREKGKGMKGGSEAEGGSRKRKARGSGP